MEKDIIVRINVQPVRAIRQSENNPYMRGLVMKRDLTTREACHIYRNIFLFDLDLSLEDFDNREERDDFYKDITEKMNYYIKGDVCWNDLCEATYCWDEDDGGEPPYDGKQWLDLSCKEYEIPEDKFKDGDNVEIIIRKTQKGE